MKKFSILFTILLLFSTNTFAFAELPRTGLLNTARTFNSTNSSAREEIKANNQVNTTTNLQQRAKMEITRRLNFLNELLTKLDSIKKLSDSDKQTLKTEIQSQIDGLTALQAKISADTDLTTLRTDVKSIINGYYIFAFFRVKIELLVAAERMSTTTDNLNTIYTKLDTRVLDLKSQGKDTSVMESELSGMLLKINDAKTQYQAVETELASLTSQGFPGNKSTLTDARAKIKLGSQDLRSAYELAQKVRQGLGEQGGNLGPKTGTHSAEQTLGK